MKRLISLIFLIGLFCTVQASTYIDGLYYELNQSGLTAKVTYKFGDTSSNKDYVSGDLIIPEKVIYDGVEYSVTYIGNYAFNGCSGLTSVRIPNSVTFIGIYAFYGCSDLTSVEFNAENCQECGSYLYPAFPANITNLTIGNNVKIIPDYAFYGCSGLTSIVIPNSVTSIGSYAFGGCSGLKKSAYPSNISNPFGNGFSIQYPAEDSEFEEGFIYGENRSTIYFVPLDIEGDFTIPNSVTTIGSVAFSGCSGLTSITIPNSVTSIGVNAFYDCSNLTTVEFNAENCQIWGYYFGYPTFPANITNLTIGNKVKVIPDYAFGGCSGLTSVEIPNSVTSIGNSAFSGCSGLTSITIPNSVTSIESYAFSGCSGLTSIEIPNSVTSIGDGVFRSCSGLTSITIPKSVTSIGISAFSGCSGLTSITIPNSVTSIGDEAFRGCSGLTSITIPNSVTYIEYRAFYGCCGLTSIEIPNSITSIGNDAFEGCSGLTSIEIPSSVTSIGDYAFYGCSGLKTIIFYSNSLLNLGQSTFSECYEIEFITCHTQRPPVADSFDVFSDQVYSNAKLYVPEEQKNLYYTIIPWSKFRNIYGSDYTPGEEEKVFKIVPILAPSQTLTLGVKNIETNSLEDSFSWNSSDSYVADVNSQGIVTAKAVGETVISASNSDGESAEFEIIVVEGDDVDAVNELLLESEGNSNVYTLGGMVVIRDASQEDLRTLTPGIYIIRGKKVIVK